MDIAPHYELLVIGAGSGGVRAARLAAEAGHSVAIIEKSRVGGTCVIRGCVPKKLMVYGAEFEASLRLAREYGWDVGDARPSWDVLTSRVGDEVDRLEGLYRQTLEKAGVTLIEGCAKFEADGSVEVDTSSQSLTADKILIATGSKPCVPSFPGADLVISSDEFFSLPKQPKRALIVGGGYIACEFASILKGMGSQVTQITRGDRILRGFPAAVVERVSKQLFTGGLTFYAHKTVDALQRLDGELLVSLSCGQSIVVDQVIYAAGRDPNVADLNLHAAEIKTDKNGAIASDNFSKTTREGVFAIGDVTGRSSLTPVAIRDAAAFFKSEFKACPTPVTAGPVATAVFSRPEAASVGHSVEAAHEDGINVEVFEAEFRPMRTVFDPSAQRTFLQIVTAHGSGTILGAHMVGDGAAESIQLMAVAVAAKLTKSQLDRTVALHPTTAEEWVTMKSGKVVRGADPRTNSDIAAE